MGVSLIVWGIIFICLSIVQIFGSFGLWKLKRWGLISTIIVEAIFVLQTVLAIILTREVSAPTLLLSLVLPLTIVIYLLTSRAAKKAFRSPSAQI